MSQNTKKDPWADFNGSGWIGPEAWSKAVKALDEANAHILDAHCPVLAGPPLEVKRLECECGAKHTVNPTLHADWCIQFHRWNRE